MISSCSVRSMCRNSGSPHRLTSLRAPSLPAPYCTITSVPPAIGSHTPGSRASSSSTLDSLPGATSSYSEGCALMSLGLSVQLQSVLPLRLLQKSAYSRCNGTGSPPALREPGPVLAKDCGAEDEPSP